MPITALTVLYLSIAGGAVGVLGKLALVSFSAIQLIFLRVFISALFFGLYFLYKGKLKFVVGVILRNKWSFAALAIFGVGGGMVLGFLGLERTTAINYDLLFNTSAIFMALFAFKISRAEVGLFGAAFFGAILLITGGKFTEVLENTDIVGDIFVFLGAIGWALYSMGGKKLGHKDPEVTADIQVAGPFILASVVLGAYIAVYEPFSLSQFLNFKASFAAILLALGATAGLFFVWFKFLHSANGVLAGIVTFSENIGGVLLPVLILDERLTFISGIGAALIVGAVVLYEYLGVRGDDCDMVELR